MIESQAHVEERIVGALRLLRAMWPVMHGSPRRLVRRPAQRALYMHDDGSPRTDDLPYLDVVVSLRVDTVLLLRDWAILLLDERHLGYHVPLDWDAIGLMVFIERHARWLSEHPAGPACADELESFARQARSMAFPQRREDMRIGNCTNHIGVDGVATLCDTEIRVNASHPGDIRCPRCGLEDTLDGWIKRIVGDDSLVTAQQLLPILRQRMGVVLTTSAIRKWVQLGDLPVAGQDDQGRNLFDRRAAFLVIKRREARVSVTA